ncbi:hypothetical protein [Maribacter polysaccharolyticus]|uniref:hypothetical protein n=1 Tax=Maribacter polysaccharolyticus TaxID=3020831 RepID=UPI00237FA67B|nr:hypothetical protein [Maribacter polysaccharolyticus]MDE3743318.1 hypothetical protein [Maribacter polysaccharolyticus]
MPLVAQEKITLDKLETLFRQVEDKTNVIHFNGGWSNLESRRVLLILDYLNQNKNLNIYPIISHQNETEKTAFLKWFERHGLKIKYYEIPHEDILKYILGNKTECYVIDHVHRTSWTSYSSSKRQKEKLLEYVNKDSNKTIGQIELLYLPQSSLSPAEGQEITSEEFEQLFALNENKTKIVHINGSVYGCAATCFPLLKYVDYAQKNARDDIEIVLVLAKGDKKTSNIQILRSMVEKSRAYGMELEYYIVDSSVLLDYGYNAVPSSIIVDHKMKSTYDYSERSNGKVWPHVNFLLSLVKEKASKTKEEVDVLYKQK